MGRRSKLTNEQWAEVENRAAAGDSLRQLAREFDLSDSTLREHLTKVAEGPAQARARLPAPSCMATEGVAPSGLLQSVASLAAQGQSAATAARHLLGAARKRAAQGYAGGQGGELVQAQAGEPVAARGLADGPSAEPAPGQVP